VKRTLYTVLASAVFLAMLTATKKRRKPREAGSIPKLTIPSTTGWASHEVAGIRFVTPPNATVTRADQLPAIRIQLASGKELAFSPTAIDIPARRSSWSTDFVMFDAPDAAIVLHELGSGDECQALACSSVPVLGSPLCIDGFSRNNDECTQVVAIARSIQPR